jgi:hypothetical protein
MKLKKFGGYFAYMQQIKEWGFFCKFEIAATVIKMNPKRKMAMVVNQVKMEDEDELDIEFWLSKTPAERLTETVRLRRNYYTWLNGSYPEKMERVISQRKM